MSVVEIMKRSTAPSWSTVTRRRSHSCGTMRNHRSAASSQQTTSSRASPQPIASESSSRRPLPCAEDPADRQRPSRRAPQEYRLPGSR
eukprot:2958793-Heterocapsa_arctica.AAC.1